jgi:hypothetical protein
VTLFIAATVTPQVDTIGFRKRRRAGSALMRSRGSDHERMERMQYRVRKARRTELGRVTAFGLTGQ